MKKYLYSVLALALLVVFSVNTASAAGKKQDLVNPDTGTAWRKKSSTDNAEVNYRVGQVTLNVLLADVSAASNTRVVVPVTDMRVEFIQTVLLATITTADSLATFSVANSDGVTRQEITNGVSKLTWSVTTAGASDKTGDVDTFTPSIGSSSNHVGQGDVILIATNGASTSASGAMVTITLVPR